MIHLTDKQLELCLQSKDNFDRDESAYISEHLESCHRCKERLAKLQAYYNDLEREIKKSPGERERSIASKIYRRRTTKGLPEGGPIQVQQNLPEAPLNSLPIRIKNQLQKHPVASASAAVGTVLVAALLLIVLPWQNTSDNPVYAEVERNVLHVYNHEGEPIWNTVADGIPNGKSSESGGRRFIRIIDVDGDDTNEVLITGRDMDGKFKKTTMYCYNSDGTLRWKQQPPPPIKFGDQTHSKVITWKVRDFFTIQSPDGDSRLFTIANSSWFPSVLLEMNGETGDILQTYWHPGWIWTFEVYENKESGNSSIILGATNNTYQKATLSVLDPDKIAGHAPMKSLYKPEEISRTDLKHYMMFKPSLLNPKYSERLYNQLSKIETTSDDELIAHAVERWHRLDAHGSILYTLDQNFRVLDARGSSRYEKTYSDQYEAGELNEPLTDQYWEALKDSVMYWDETTSEFIRHSQLNK